MARTLQSLAVGVTSALLAGCSAQTADPLNTRQVTLPGGAKILAEVMIRPDDMARGMMFRDQLAQDRGMLFIHLQPGYFPYYMKNVKVHLDMIWMDASRRIVEFSENTPPCEKETIECPLYGGHREAQYVLEMSAGSVKKHNLKLGETLSF